MERKPAQAVRLQSSENGKWAKLKTAFRRQAEQGEDDVLHHDPGEEGGQKDGPLIEPGAEPVKNFEFFFKSDTFKTVTFNTIFYNILEAVLVTVCALALAILLMEVGTG